MRESPASGQIATGLPERHIAPTGTERKCQPTVRTSASATTRVGARGNRAIEVQRRARPASHLAFAC
jgi:hypothetical protein